MKDNKDQIACMAALSGALPGYCGLEFGDARLLAADFRAASDEDGCTASEYIRRIGAGNIRSYLDSLKVGN